MPPAGIKTGDSYQKKITILSLLSRDMQIRFRRGVADRGGNNLRVPLCRDNAELASAIRTQNVNTPNRRIHKHHTCLPYFASVSDTKRPKSNLRHY